MALYKSAIKKLIPPGPNDPRLNVVVGTVGHVAVVEADSLYGYFNGPSGGVESHFYIRYDGTIEQYRDTAYEADAQSQGNSWVIGNQRYGFVSYETEGLGSGTWTNAQLASIKALITWVNLTHGSPWQKVPAYHGRGHGYHAQFPEWNPDKHACPGDARIAQFNNIIVPWLATGGKEVNPLPDPADLWDFPLGNNPGDETKPVDAGYSLQIARNYAFLAYQKSVAIEAALKALATGLDPAVQKAVEEALSSKYDATVTLTPKT